MEQNIIKFSGNNDKLFCRVPIEKLDPKLTLIVPETHNAILIKNGQMLQTISSGKYLLNDFVDPKEEDCLLEVLFMSKTAKLKLYWGTADKLVFFDEESQKNYHVGFSGDFEVQIGDPRKCYLYLIGMSDDLTAEALQDRMRSNVVSVMELVSVDYIKENHVPFNQLSLHKKAMAQKTLSALSHKLQSEYGISVFSFTISNIIFDSDDYMRLSKGKKIQENHFCPNCGAENLSLSNFCSNCGFNLSRGKVCPNCHEDNPQNAKFCSVCGTKLTD